MSSFLIYKSSAGSGKTSALVGVYLRLCLGRDDPDAFSHILGITFTNKAANEMKERVLEELESISNLPDPYSGGNYVADALMESLSIPTLQLRQRARRTLERALHHFGDLALGTIDQFSLRLIRSFSREVGVQGDFEVELDERQLFRESIHRVLDMAGRNDEVTHHLLAYITQQSDEEKTTHLARQLEGLYSIVMTEEALVPLEALSAMPPDTLMEVPKRLQADIRQFRNAVQRLGKSALELIEPLGLEPEDFKGKTRGALAYFKKLSEYQQEPLKPGADVLKSIESGSFANPSATASAKGKMSTIDEALAHMGREAIALSEGPFRKFMLQHAAYAQLHLLVLALYLYRELQALCEERNVMRIGDFNRIISRTLAHEPAPFIYEHIGARYRHILVDEFQDTSALQWLNLLPLVEESVARGHTAMVVGDAKQSIYRWRGGKAEQFIALPEFIQPEADVSAYTRKAMRDAHEVIKLDTNYRSRAEIVQFNNRLFALIGEQLTFPESLFRKEYSELNLYQKHLLSKVGGYVEVHCLPKLPKGDEKWLHLLYQQVRQALDDGYPAQRIAILVRRTSKEGKEIAAFLEERSIPVATNDGYGIDENPWVRCIIAMMRLCTGHVDVPAQVEVMRNMCYLLKVPYRPYNWVLSPKGSNCIDIDSFLQKHGLLPLTKLNVSQNAFDLCEEIVLRYLPLKRRDVFVKTLSNIIFKRAGRGGTVSKFLTWWDSLKEKPGVATDSAGGKVQLMTIHKAKGLQFDVCCLPAVSWKKQVAADIVWVKPELSDTGLPYLPIGMTKKSAEMGFEKEKSESDEAVDFDNLNLLYVAATRAVDRLYIISEHYNKGYIGNAFRMACQQMVAARQGKAGFHCVKQTDVDDWVEGLPEGDEGFIMQFGSKAPAPAGREAHCNMQVLKPAPIHGALYKSRFRIVRPTGFNAMSAARYRGELIHRMLTAGDALFAERLLRSEQDMGMLTGADVSELLILVQSVFSDSRYQRLCDGARPFAERELMLNGQVLRPDLVLLRSNQVAVVDFKTGVKDESHKLQVLGYMQALELLYKMTTLGYLLYTDKLKWVEVKAPGKVASQMSLFDR